MQMGIITLSLQLPNATLKAYKAYANANASLTAPSDSKVLGANMGPIWGRQDPGGPHVGPMKFPIWALTLPIQLNNSFLTNM